MKIISLNSVCIVLVLNVQVGFSQQTVFKEVKAKIDIEKVEDVIAVICNGRKFKGSIIKVFLLNCMLKKGIKIIPINPIMSQDGRATLEPLQKIALSKTQINVTNKDQITILLFIYDENNTVIGKDKIIIGDEVPAETNASPKPKDGVGNDGDCFK